MNRMTYGLDIAKNVMQLHWIDGETGKIRCKQLPRARWDEFFAQRQPAGVATEVRGSSHYWGRVLDGFGERMERLSAPRGRVFVRSNKGGSADVRAIWLVRQHSDIRRVLVKSVEQRATMSLHRSRSNWVSVRTATVNILRGLMYEFGIGLPGGKRAGLKTMSARHPGIGNKLSHLMRCLVDLQLEMPQGGECGIEQFEAGATEQQRQLNKARVLCEVPGIGGLGTTALSVTLDDASDWRLRRDLSASHGSVSAHGPAGGKARIGRLSKHGAPICGPCAFTARAVIDQPKAQPAWLEDLLQCRPPNVAVSVRMMAFAALALIAHWRTYRSGWENTRPSGCGAQVRAA